MQAKLNTEIKFNNKKPDVMHVDINSCFATIEQQANPKLRGKPVGVAAYKNDAACVLAASVEAKRLGIKTGTRVYEAKKIYPNVVILEPDAEKYRYVHKKLETLLKKYSPNIEAKSIDEFVLHYENTPAMKKGLYYTAQEIKDRIKNEIGEWITVSIGIGPNRFLAKTGAGLHKPNGLDIISYINYYAVYSKLKLTDLPGINKRFEARLNNVGIFDVLQFYNANYYQLKSAFKSIHAYHWYMRLRGWEVDIYRTKRSSFNHSYILPHTKNEDSEILPIMQKLVEKLGKKIRKKGYTAKGIHLMINFEYRSNGERYYKYWDKGLNLPGEMTSSIDMYKQTYRIYQKCPYKGDQVRQLSITCFYLNDKDQYQLSLFNDVKKNKDLVNTLDDINDKWGAFTIKPALMLNTKDAAPDRISFGKVL